MATATVKQYQRDDFEDREKLFSQALRKAGVQATDVDFICGDVGNVEACGVLLEVTLSELGVLCDKYLADIDARRQRDRNDYWADKFARHLMVPAYLVVYDRNLAAEDSVVWFRRIDSKGGWRKMGSWRFLDMLRRFCEKTRQG